MPAEPIDAYYARKALEVLAIRMAISKVTDADLGHLENWRIR
jgi:DNA-binding GntR family transcriptional regulator